MSQASIKYIDFEILKEFWNKYELNDGTQIKTRAILTEVRKTPRGSGFEYNFGFQGLQTIFPSQQSRGTPSMGNLTKERIRDSIWTDIRYNTMSEEWNEYVTDDRATVKLKSTVTQIKKSSLFKPNGDPIYDIRLSILPQVIPPKI